MIAAAIQQNGNRPIRPPRRQEPQIGAPVRQCHRTALAFQQPPASPSRSTPASSLPPPRESNCARYRNAPSIRRANVQSRGLHRSDPGLQPRHRGMGDPRQIITSTNRQGGERIIPQQPCSRLRNAGSHPTAFGCTRPSVARTPCGWGLLPRRALAAAPRPAHTASAPRSGRG